jgi:hypothetical protein
MTEESSKPRRRSAARSRFGPCTRSQRTIKPTGYVIKAVELEPIREKLARAGLVCIPRQEGDERQIVESWIMTGEIIPKGEPGLGTALAENDGNIAKVPELRAFCF